MAIKLTIVLFKHHRSMQNKLKLQFLVSLIWQDSDYGVEF